MEEPESWTVPRGFRARPGPGGPELYRDPEWRTARRIRGVLDSLHRDIRAGSRVRVRQVLEGPVDVFRLESERPDLACTRTTLMDRDALETLLEEVGEDAVQGALDLS